jgi:trigger factor
VNVTNRELSVSDDSEVRLTLTVAGDSVRETYDSIIADLRRNARLKGFRRGKAPREVLVRKFGPALLAQTTEQVIRESLEQTIGEIEHKPLPFAAPALDSEPQLVLGEDLTYTVTYDTFPQVELGPYRDLPLERPQVSIADADLERELGRLQEQNAVVIDKQADDSGQVVVAQGDVVTVNYVEQDAAGQPVPGSERRDFVFEVGTEYNIYQMDEDLVGMARGEEKVIAKSYSPDYQYSDLAGRAVTLKVTVTAVKEKQLPDLDDELAQDVSDRFETLDDLKADLRSRLQDDADRRVRARLIGELMDKVVETSQVPVPKSMIAAEMEAEWRNLVARSGVDARRFESALAERGDTRDQLMEQTRPLVERRARYMLVRDRLAQAESIEISDEDLERHLAQQAEARGVDAEELRAQYERQNALDYVRSELRHEKLYDHLIAASAVSPGAETSYVDLIGANQ